MQRATPETDVVPVRAFIVSRLLDMNLRLLETPFPADDFHGPLDSDLLITVVHCPAFGSNLHIDQCFRIRHCLNRAIERISRDYNAQETELAAKEDREPLLLPHFSVHNLRHTFCTRLFEVEPDCKFIQQVMGHADISTTMDIYTHITQEKMNSTVQSISKKLDLF